MSTFRERYAEKKKEQGAETQSFRQRYTANNTDFKSLAENVRNRTDTWLKNQSAFFANYRDRYSKDEAYREDSSEWHSTVSAQKHNFDAEARNIVTILDQYAGVNDEWDSFSREIKDLLTKGSSAQSIVTNRALQDDRFREQFGSRENYDRWNMGWLSDDAKVDYGSAQQRKAYYENNNVKIGKLGEQIAELESSVYGSRIVSSGFSPNIGVGDTEENREQLKTLKAQREALIAENNRYENEQKVLDDYYRPITDEFKQNAAYRDYKNISVGDAAGYGVDKDTAWNTLSNGGYWDKEGNLRDKDDNVVGKSEDTFSFALEDKLGAYLNTSTEDRVAIQNELQRFANTDPLTTYQNMIFEAENGAWDQLTESEINIYYDLYKTQGQEAAYKYLSDMKDVLNKRATQEKLEDIRNSEGWEQFGWNVASIPMNVIGGATAFVDDAINVISGNDVNPYSKAHLWQNMGQTVREETAKEWDESTGNIAVPWLDFSVGDLYQAGMSTADSLLGASTLGKGYSVLMGMGAASAKAKELYEKGASKSQIVAGSLLAGAAEVVFESIGIDGLLKAKNAKNLKDVVVNALKQSGTEALEEMGTEAANAITDAIVMGSQSDWVDFESFVKNVVNAGLSGAISGGLGGGTMAAAGSALQAADYQTAVKDHGQAITDFGDVKSLQKHAEAMIKDKNTPNVWEIKQQLKKVQNNSSAKNVGRLSAAMSDSVQMQNRKENVQQLKKEGLSKKQADSVYNAILQMEDSISRAGSDTARLAAEQKFVDALAKMGLDDATQSAVAAVAQDLIENPQNASQSRLRELMNSRVNSVDPKDLEILQRRKEIPTEGRISSDGTTRLETTGESVQIRKEDPIAKIENGTVFLNTDKGVLETSDLQFANEEELHLYEAVSDLDAGTASVIVTGYDGNIPALDYVSGMEEGVLLYGKHGFQTVGKDISDKGYFAGLSEENQQTALALGRELRAEETRQKTERVREAIERAKAEREKSSEAQKNTAKDGGKVKTQAKKKTELLESVVQASENLSGTAQKQGEEIVAFIENVNAMMDKAKRSKRKQKVGDLSAQHIKLVNELMRTIDPSFSAEGFELWIDGTAASHIVDRHGESGKADHTMASEESKKLIPWAAQTAETCDFIREADGRIKRSDRFMNSDRSMAPEILLTKDLGKGAVCISECVPDSNQKIIWITSAYIKRSSKDQLLNLEDSSRQLTPEAVDGGNATKNSIPQNSEKVKTEGKIFFDDSVELSELTKKQRAEVEYAGNVISAAIGNEIHFFDSRHALADSREARTNGWYDPKDGSIHLDIAKLENGEESVLFTLSHELVHFIEDWSPAKYQTFADFLLKNYADHDVKTESLVRRKMAELKTTDYDYAMSELVADACERMLLDSNASEKLAELSKTDKRLVEKIKSFLAKILKKIRQAYAQYKGREEAQLLQKMEDKLSEFYALFEDALTDAAQNYRDADGKLASSEVREQAKAYSVEEEINNIYNQMQIILASGYTHSNGRVPSDLQLFQEYKTGKKHLTPKYELAKYLLLSRDEAQANAWDENPSNVEEAELALLYREDPDEYLKRRYATKTIQPESKLYEKLFDYLKTNDIVFKQIWSTDKEIPLDNYSETQYNNFGWVSYNGIITPRERQILLSDYAGYKHGDDYYAVTKRGEAVIFSPRCPNVVMYVRGTIEMPEITKVVRIDADPEEIAPYVAERVIKNERRKTPKPWSFIEDTFEEGLFQLFERRNFASFQEYRSEFKRGSRRTNDSSDRAERDGGRGSGTLSGVGQEVSDGGEKFQRKLTSTREILANVDLNTVDLSNRGGDQLAAHLKEYQEKEKELKQHEAKVRSLSEDILRMRKAREDGKPYDSSKMDELLAERNRESILASQLRRSMQLITKAPEVSKFVEREKLTSWRQNRDEIERGKMERARVTELKHRARKKAETLNKMLTKPTKKIHVKSGLQKAVASFLYALNLDTVNYESRIKFLETRIKFAEREIEEELKRSGITKKNAEAFEEQFSARVEKRIQEITASKEWNELRNMSMLDKISDLRKGLAAYMEEEKIAETPNRKMILELLDRNSVFLEVSAKQRIEDLKTKIENEEDPVERAYLSVRLEMLNQQKDFLPLGAMSLGELQVVDDSLSQVLAMVRDANKVFDDNKAMEAADASDAARAEVKLAKKPREIENRITEVGDAAFWSMLMPETAFHLIGSDTLVRLYEDITDGSHQWGVLVDRAHRYFAKTAERYDYLKWRNDDTLHSFQSSNGKTFQLNLQEIMSLYAYSRRGDQALDHIINGGVVKQNSMVPATKTVEKNGKEVKIPFGYKPESNTAYKISRETLSRMFAVLTPEQKKFVEDMQKYLSEDCSEQGNKTSLILYGIRLFKEKIYFPIRTWSEAEAFDPDAGGDSMIVNSSFTKATIKGATRAIVLDNFETVWAKHTEEMAKYATMSVPIENFLRVWNVKSASDLPGNTPETLSTVIRARWGANASEYVRKFISDVNGGARKAQEKDPLDRALSKTKKAAVVASLSVAIQQPSSIARAAAYIDPKYMVKGSLKNIDLREHEQRWEEVKKYAPVAITKEMGGFDTGVGKGTVDWILSYEYGNVKERICDALKDPNRFRRLMKESDDVFGWLPSFMDEISWGKIWFACKRQVAAEQGLKIDSEKCKVEAGKLFTMVINRTQVYDSSLVKSGLMRNGTLGAKLLSQFAAEPTVTVNMHAMGIIEASRNGKSGRKFFHRTNAAILCSKIINAALVAVIYALRDDDEDETLPEKYLEHFIEKGIDELNPLNSFPILRDINSWIQGFSSERPDADLAADLIYTTKQWWSDEKSVLEKLRGSAESLSSMFGIPVKNLLRDADAVARGFSHLFGAYPRQTTGQGLSSAMYEALPFAKADKGNGLYRAYVSGDAVQIERYRSNYDSAEKWTTAVRTALKENDPRILQAAIAQLNGNASERVRIQKEIIGEGNFSQDLIVTATNGIVTSFQSKIRTASEAKRAGNDKDYAKIVKELQKAGYPDDLISKYVGEKVEALQKEEEAEAEAGEKAMSWYRSSDVADAYASGDEKLALEIINDLIRVKTENSTEEKAEDKGKTAKSSVKSIVTEYWKPRYKEAHKNGNQAEMKRIRYILKDTGLYGSVDELVKTCNRWLNEKE